ncbi:unnamed protein product [Acidithrix sp. C25]|nr:unnamed protein product [Acidithrix sp. C25]
MVSVFPKAIERFDSLVVAEGLQVYGYLLLLFVALWRPIPDYIIYPKRLYPKRLSLFLGERTQGITKMSF